MYKGKEKLIQNSRHVISCLLLLFIVCFLACCSFSANKDVYTSLIKPPPQKWGLCAAISIFFCSFVRLSHGKKNVFVFCCWCACSGHGTAATKGVADVSSPTKYFTPVKFMIYDLWGAHKRATLVHLLITFIDYFRYTWLQILNNLNNTTKQKNASFFSASNFHLQLSSLEH